VGQQGEVLGAVAVGGSAGSLSALTQLVAGLPADLPAAVLVTVHIGEGARSRLPAILGRAGRLPAQAAADGDRLEAGHVYVAPPGRHLLVGPDGLQLSAGPRVNRQRPAIDVMLAGTASTFRSRSIAVILSGVLDDGAVGAALVARAGGQVLAQADAEFSSMPRAALRAAPGALAVPAAELAAGVVAGLTTPRPAAPEPAEAAMDDPLGDRLSMATSDEVDFLANGESRLTRLSCPECSGAMAQVDLPQISYFVCHVGHRYSPLSLVAAQAENAESTLWTAVAALEEQAAVLAHLRRHASPATVADLPVDADEIVRRAGELRSQARQWSDLEIDGEPEQGVG
jgi:two-component system chemotaxis response regulator CheB